jgi:glycerate kinase
LVAPTAFKGTLTPGQAAAAIAQGLMAANPGAEVELAPLSDGGDGFLECIEARLGAARRSVVVRGPDHAPLAAAFGLSAEGVAVVEAALAVGLARLGSRGLDPLGASSGGLGELLAETRQAGASEILLGLGGSASTDGGTGMARALGYRFLDAAGVELPEGGGYLTRLARVDSSGFDPAWLMLPIRVACDVDNPLLGPTGSAAMFGPQKGAHAAEVGRLEAGLARLAEVVLADLGVDLADRPHGGAAGGLGAGLVGFLGAELVPGAELVLEVLELDRRIAGAGLLVTGEGRLDGQSLHGKAPVAAGRLARAHGVPALALVGSVGEGWKATLGDAFDEVRSLPAGDAADAAQRLEATAAGVQLQGR